MTAGEPGQLTNALAGATFDLDEQRQAILEAADDFARNELYPLATRMDNEEWWPPEAFPKIGKMGFFGVTVPSAYGGADSDLFSSGLILQAISRWNHALGLSWVAHENLVSTISIATATRRSAGNIFLDSVRGRRPAPWR